MKIHIDDKTLANMYRLQRNAALDDVAALTAAVQSLEMENARLRGPKVVDSPPAKLPDQFVDERTS